MSSLAQQALDLSVDSQTKISNGIFIEKEVLLDICASVQLLAQSILGATPSADVIGDGSTMADVSTTTAVNTPGS